MIVAHYIMQKKANNMSIVYYLIIYFLVGILYTKFWEYMIRKNKLVPYHKEMILGYKSMVGNTNNYTIIKSHFSFLDYKHDLLLNVFFWGLIIIINLIMLICNSIFWLIVKTFTLFSTCVIFIYKLLSKFT